MAKKTSEGESEKMKTPKVSCETFTLFKRSKIPDGYVPEHDRDDKDQLAMIPGGRSMYWAYPFA